VLNRDSPYFDRLVAHAGASNAGRVISFGEHEAADVRALRIATGPDASMVEADVLGRMAAYRVGAAGRHMALNSLAVMAAVAALGLDPNEAAGGLADLSAPVGRGERVRLNHPDGEFLGHRRELQRQPGLDAGRAGDTGKRRDARAPPRGPGRYGRTRGHGTARPCRARRSCGGLRADLVFAAGPLMRGLWDALPPKLHGAYAASAAELEPVVLEAVRPGDTVMVKGSKFTQVSKIVTALKLRYGQAAAAATGRG
jgi:UDP-N-acetylmuramoyl-tripeptide--D-alanyl-D-alanine ligase